MKFAAIRIRGVRDVSPRIKKTLELLRLEKPNNCILVDDTPQNMGMLDHAKDYITYGPVDEGTIYSLLSRRGRKGSKMLRTLMKEDELKKAAKEISGGKKTVEFADPVFRMRPPTKGYRDIKVKYPSGELGKRESMAPLLKKMM
jgi:large subunit ribosomal protein L30